MNPKVLAIANNAKHLLKALGCEDQATIDKVVVCVTLTLEVILENWDDFRGEIEAMRDDAMQLDCADVVAGPNGEQSKVWYTAGPVFTGPYGGKPPAYEYDGKSMVAGV